MTSVISQLVQAQPHPVLDWLTGIWNGMVLAVWVSLVLTALLIWGYFACWRKGELSRIASILYGLQVLIALLWIPFLAHWDLLLPAA
jgi:hypothetical protein